MKEEQMIGLMLEQIPQPGFLVQADKIIQVNQAAQALLLSPGMAFSPMLEVGAEEYAEFQSGQMYLTLAAAQQHWGAAVTRMEDQDLILLEPREDPEEFRSMSLISMELRKPLMQAIASAQHLADGGSAEMNRSLMQMQRLVDNLSDIGRYLAGCRPELQDINALLLEQFEKAAALAQERVSISYSGLRQPLFCLVDPEQLERAVWNILSNCIRFTPTGGQIQATLTRKGKRLCLTVQDSGSGIAQDVRGNLFRQYLRRPGIEDGRYGLGLGLSMIRAVAANHGGTVLIDSKETGTRIAMTLEIRENSRSSLRSPIFRLDHSGGWDHGLVELSDCLPAKYYQTL